MLHWGSSEYPSWEDKLGLAVGVGFRPLCFKALMVMLGKFYPVVILGEQTVLEWTSKIRLKDCV